MSRLAIVFLTACALTSKSPPLELRYFAPALAPSTSSVAGHGCARLELGEVTASSLLRYRIAHRESPVELALYETLRWTERPDQYARHAVTRALFDRGRLDQAVDGAVPVLEVELAGFEQVANAGRVELRYSLHDPDRVLTRGTIAIERPAATAGIDAVVAAIGTALDAAADELAARVARELCPSRIPGA